MVPTAFIMIEIDEGNELFLKKKFRQSIEKYEIILEHLGGAHRDKELMLQNIKKSISKNLEYFKDLSSEEIINERKNKFLKIGRNKGFITGHQDLSKLTIMNNNFDQILKSKKILIGLAIGSLTLLIVGLTLF